MGSDLRPRKECYFYSLYVQITNYIWQILKECIGQYPYRTIQIVLRLYHSPAEILAGFDVDSGCFLYDGNTVYGNPRAIVSVMRQCNTVDMSRRSPSYEVRLAKYAARGFEVYVDDLRRGDIDPTVSAVVNEHYLCIEHRYRFTNAPPTPSSVSPDSSS